MRKARFKYNTKHNIFKYLDDNVCNRAIYYNTHNFAKIRLRNNAGFSGFVGRVSQTRMPHIEQQQQAAGRKKKALVNLILVV